MTLPVIFAIGGCVALIVGLFGGGIKVKEIEVPTIAGFPRLLLGFIGVALIGLSTKFYFLDKEVVPTPVPSQSVAMVSSVIQPSSTLTSVPATSTSITDTATSIPASSTPVPATATSIPPVSFTQTIQVIDISNCVLGIGQDVHLGDDVRYWSKPNVLNADYAPAQSGATVYIIGGPIQGRIRVDINISGWWWEVSASKNGSSLGWVWEDKFVECR